jgi:hypothetical protein
VARFDRVIPPGQEGEIVATINTHKFRGKIHKRVSVRTSDPQNPTASLALQANVKTWVEVLPGWSANLTADQGEGARRVLYIQNREMGKALDVSSATSSNSWVTASVEKIEPGAKDSTQGQFRLVLELSPETPVGPITGKVIVSTSSEKQRTIQVGLTGKVHGPISVFPAIVNLFAQPNTGRPDRLNGTIVLQSRPNQPPFELGEVTADDERLELEIVSDPQNRRHRISVHWAETDTKGDFAGTIKIQTTHPKMPQVEVPYRARIL